MSNDTLEQMALDYHRNPVAGKLSILPKGTLFLCDTHVTPNPTMEEISEMILLGAETVRRFGETPRAALLSHSNFGTADTESAIKMRKAVAVLKETAPELEVEGEMHADAAIDPAVRERIFPNSKLKGRANLLILPNLEAANNAFNLLKSIGDGLPVGPIFVGAGAPAHILMPSVTARGIVNMSALAVVDAQSRLRAAQYELLETQP